jgi:hypothetical protein
MKWFIISLTIFILSITSPCSALDYLDEVNLIDNIIKSFDEESENWYFGTSYCVYAKTPKQLKKTFGSLYPEHDPNSILVIHFNLNRAGEQSYIHFKKPDSYGFISEGRDKSFEKFSKALKIQVYKKLKKQVGYEVDNKSSKEVKKEEKAEVKKKGYL